MKYLKQGLGKTVSILAVLSLSTFALSATAHDVDSKEKVEQTHDITGFDAISVAGIYKLEVEVGDDFSVFTSGKAKDVAHMKVYLKGSTLVLDQNEDGPKHIKMKRKNNNGITARITLPSLNAIDIAGIGTGEINGVDSDSFDIDIAGISDLEISGNCDRLEADMAGMGDLDAQDLECKDVNVDLAGMGQMKVYASDSVNADAAGMGQIEVYGNPKDVEKSKNFMASVKLK